MIRPIIAGLAAALLLVGCATVADTVARGGAGGAHDYPEARSYAVSDNAAADVDAALARAAESDKRVLLVMGANWCHDSRALAGWLETERFAALIEERYELVFVNIGTPQSEGDAHNLHIARRFGLEDLPGTPNLLVVTPAGELVNADTATTWRNAASREEDAIYDELVMLAEQTAPSASATNETVDRIWVEGSSERCRFASSQNGPWVDTIEELGKISAETRPAEASGEWPWRCLAEVIVAIQAEGGAPGFISNPTEP